jgi:prepilin-type N-terminal cleavage/methylation domain-containing protein
MKKAFTMLELIFVIVVIGIIGTVGANVLSVMYKNYISSAVNNQMQAQTELALQQISNRLNYRIKDSVIAANDVTFDGLSDARDDVNYTRIEWVGYDIDGWLGDAATTPAWSGFIDVDNHNTARLSSPGSDFRAGGRIDTNIQALSGSTIADAAIFFVGTNTDVQNDYGWNGSPYDVNNTAMHRVAAAPNTDEIVPITAGANAYTFAGMDVYEQYKLAWTAYAIGIDPNNDNLYLYYDYQPWESENYNDAGTKRALLLEHVSTIKAQAIGDVIKLQICVDNNISGNTPSEQRYTICKEKVIF